MADDSYESSKPGCFSRIVSLIITVVFFGAGVCIFLVAQPQDLSALKEAASASAPASTREMKAVLQNAIDRGYPVPLTEAQINQWLGRTVVGKQGGPLKLDTVFKNVWVKLDENIAEIIMERDVMGYVFTSSMFLQIEKRESAEGMHTEIILDGGPFHPSFPKPPRGGRLGQLVVPQGFLLLLMPAYEKLAVLFKEEIDLGFREMSSIKIEKGKLVLDPRPHPEADSLLPN
jgi:hypothetical protein